MFTYTDERKLIIDKDINTVCEQLFELAKKNNEKINTIAFNPSDNEVGTLFKMWWGQTIKGIKINGGSFKYKPFMDSIHENDCNVLVIQEKMLNVNPSIRLMVANEDDSKTFGINHLKYIIVIRDDVKISNNITSFVTSCAVDDWVENRNAELVSLKNFLNKD